MCYNYNSTQSIAKLQEHWDAAFEQITAEDEWRPVQQVAAWEIPKPIMPVIIKENGKLVIKLFEWVVAPSWIDDPEEIENRKPASGNARKDRLLESKLWKPLIEKNQTCLVLATGIFEYHHFGGEAIPYFIYDKEQKPFAMPGVYSVNHRLDEPFYTFSIVTDDANPKMKSIHNGGNNPGRQAIWFNSRNQELNWLDDEISPNEKIESLEHYPDDSISYHAVAKDFRKTEFKYDGRVTDKVDYPLIGLP